MPYIPGDNWIICDLSGRKVLMSQSRKTWDGLRVHPDFWYPRHPQLDLRAIPDRMAVRDGRPRQIDVFIYPPYGYGSFCLTSLNGVHWTFYAADDGALLSVNVLYGNPVKYLYVGNYRLYADDDGALHAEPSDSPNYIVAWKMRSSVGEVIYDLTVGSDLSVFLTVSTWYI